MPQYVQIMLIFTFSDDAFRIAKRLPLADSCLSKLASWLNFQCDERMPFNFFRVSGVVFPSSLDKIFRRGNSLGCALSLQTVSRGEYLNAR
jgi:hypothetical protein